MVTIEELVEFGMVKSTHELSKCGVDIYEKKLQNDLTLCLTQERNENEFCISTGDGKLFLNIETVDDLKTVERLISDWDPNY